VNERIGQETQALQIQMSKRINEALHHQSSSNHNTTRSSIKERQNVIDALQANQNQGKKLEQALN
jgi:hypothetical protein